MKVGIFQFLDDCIYFVIVFDIKFNCCLLLFICVQASPLELYLVQNFVHISFYAGIKMHSKQIKIANQGGQPMNRIVDSVCRGAIGEPAVRRKTVSSSQTQKLSPLMVKATASSKMRFKMYRTVSFSQKFSFRWAGSRLIDSGQCRKAAQPLHIPTDNPAPIEVVKVL